MIGGVVLLVLAYQAHNSAVGSVTNFVSGSPSDQAMQYGIGGLVCLVLGLGGAAKACGGGK